MHLIIGLKATTYVQHRPAPTHVDWFVDNRLLHTDPPSQDQYKYPVAITKGIKTLTKVKKTARKVKVCCLWLTQLCMHAMNICNASRIQLCIKTHSLLCVF